MCFRMFNSFWTVLSLSLSKLKRNLSKRCRRAIFRVTGLDLWGSMA